MHLCVYMCTFTCVCMYIYVHMHVVLVSKGHLYFDGSMCRGNRTHALQRPPGLGSYMVNFGVCFCCSGLGTACLAYFPFSLPFFSLLFPLSTPSSLFLSKRFRWASKHQPLKSNYAHRTHDHHLQSICHMPDPLHQWTQPTEWHW